MLTDVQIAQNANMLPIEEIAKSLGIDKTDIELYGNYKAKLSYKLLKNIQNNPDGKLVLVTAMNPTPHGEGKTTMSIGIGQAFAKLGKKTIIALREPSLGPVFGLKGGACGGGYSQVLPMEDINLHFTGDMHAITSANNLLASMIDNHIHQGNKLNIDIRTIVFKRVLDLNDRALRNAIVGLGGKVNGYPREDGFQITVASEVMAILCLSNSLEELKEKLSKIIIGCNLSGEPVTCEDIGAAGAMTALLKDALKPNLVQTVENTPAIIHGGPFANIAHGCNSILATKTALKLADYCITEAGFGADLGAEKFLDIKCPAAHIAPDCICIVATVRALKHNGNPSSSDPSNEDIPALERGFANLKRHYENMKKYGVPTVITINKFPQDTNGEISALEKLCDSFNMPHAINTSHIDGGNGGIKTAELIIDSINAKKSAYKPLYSYELSIKEKIEKIAREIYRASKINYSSKALKSISAMEKSGFGRLPVCIAKTQYSFTDDKDKLGAPENFEISVRDVSISAGAGFAVVYLGDILTMPGLPSHPAALDIDVDADGLIVGLF